MSGRHLVVLTHRQSLDFNRYRYLLRFLTDHWQKHAIRVSVIDNVERPVQGDALLLHVNRTTIPDAYMEFAKRYPVVINRHVRDISKRSFSRQILQPGDFHEGAVIVKTDANCGGKADVRAAGRGSRAVNRILKRYGDLLPWRSVRVLNSKEYPIFDSIEDVPAGVWRNPNLVVEKFLPERDASGNYHLRVWYFLGSREFIEFDTSPLPIVKGKKIFSRVQDHHVPDDLRQLRRRLGFDYGKFDFAVVEGKTVLYDINRTPTVGETTLRLFRQPLLENLAQGLDEFLP